MWIKKSIISIVFLSCFFSFRLLAFPLNIDNSSQLSTEKQYFYFFDRAEKSRKTGKYEDSINLFEKSLILARRIPDEKKEYESLSRLGLLYWNKGRLVESSDFYKKALFLATRLNLNEKKEEIEKMLKIFEFYTRGKKYRSSANYKKSVKAFDRAIELSREIRSKEHELKCLRQLSITHFYSNELKKFQSLNKKSLEIARSLNHKKEEGKCLNNLGLFYWKLDNYSRALSYYEEALEIARDLKNKEEQSNCLNNIAIIYTIMGDYDYALNYLKRALSIDKNLGNKVYISIDLSNIGDTFRNKGLISRNNEDFSKALGYFKDCLRLTRKTNNLETEIRVLNNIGTVYSDLKNYSEAMKYFREGYEKAKKIKNIEVMAMILNNIGIIHYNQGNYEKSTQCYQKAIDLALQIEGGQILWEAYLESGKSFQKQNKFQESLENYRNSIKIIEDIRSQIMLEEQRASYLGTNKRIEAYHELINLLVSLHRASPLKKYDNEAFYYLEKAKARSFLDSLELSRVNISQGIDSKLKNREKEIFKDISMLYSKFLAAQASPEEKKNIQNQLKDKENELEALKRKIYEESPSYAGLKYPEIITLHEAQKILPDKKTAFIAYSIGKENSYSFVITKKKLNIFPIPKRSSILELVSDHMQAITDRESQNFQPYHKLFNTIISTNIDKNIKSIIFIPDDVLHFLPFETLLPSESDTHWLIEDYEISYAPSISSYRAILERKKVNGSRGKMQIAAFGDPDFSYFETKNNSKDVFHDYYSSSAFSFYRLKYSETEIKKISSLFKRKKRSIFTGKNASKKQLRSINLEDYKIIHFATHSLIDDKNPARSSIVLSCDKKTREDGFLQMREVYNLKLNADLVTLSACQTGVGKFIKGEGIEGLNRAFFYSGTSAVLMSLWPVNDQATCQLMERFYTHLRSSESIAEALRKTKLEMINSGILSHPYYWAGFIVSGKADQIIFPDNIFRQLLIIIILSSAVVIILFSVRRKKFQRVIHD